jgi:gluconolactonase
LLQPPRLIELSRFTSLPPEFRRRTSIVWADANRPGRATDSFLEGLVFDGEGSLYVTDILFGRIFRVDVKGRWELVEEYDGEPTV